MAKFIVRVELIDAETETYTAFHKQMYKKGFTRSISLDNTQKLYMLPDAEYYYNGVIDDINVIKTNVEFAALTTNKKHKIVITKAEEIEATGLNRVMKLN